ncbi:5115_t:CDS:1, partial [Gigaspora margarita]
DYKIQVAYFPTLTKKNQSATIIQRAYRLWQKRINSAKVIQYAVIKWLYRDDGPFMKDGIMTQCHFGDLTL